MAKTTARAKPAPAKPTPKSAKPPAKDAAKAKPAIAAALPAPKLAVATELQVGKVFASPLNPRRSMDPATLAPLADSIVANGLLQSVLARPAPGGRHEIICGARRLAAIELAVKDGRLPKDYRFPGRVRDCSDAELVELAAMENLDREDIHPLDEAEVFAALRKYVKPPAGVTVEAAIGKKLGVVERTVFRRLALLRLAPELQKALRAKEISLGQAAAFSLGHHNDQRHHLKVMKVNSWQTDPPQIQRAMTVKRVAVDKVGIDLKLYKGEIVEDPETGARYLADMEEATKLFDAAIAAKREKLLKSWKWVDVVRGSYIPYESYRDCRKDDAAAGAVILADPSDLSLDVTPSQIRAATARDREAARPKTAAAAAAPKEETYLTAAQAVAVHLTKTRAMRRAVAGRPELGLALAIMGLLGAQEVSIRDEANRGPHNHIPKPPLFDQERRAARLKPLEKIAVGRGPKTDAAAFRVLVKLPQAELLEILAELVSERIGSWTDYQPRPWDTAFAVAIAEEAGAAAELAPFWQPNTEYFAGYSKTMLHRLASQDLALLDGFNRLNEGEQVDRLAKQPPLTWTPSRFTELRFLEEAPMRKEFAGAAPPAPTPLERAIAAAPPVASPAAEAAKEEEAAD